MVVQHHLVCWICYIIIRNETWSTGNARDDLAGIMVPLIVLTTINNIPAGAKDLLEFAFFCGVGITAGSLGLL